VSTTRTPAEVRRYQTDGFLSPIRVLSADQAERCRGEVERLHEALAAIGHPRPPSQAHLHFRWAHDLVTDARILDAVESVLGPDILVHSTTVFGKQPGDGRYVSWHQDGYYINLSVPAFVSAWVALTDSAPDNGCLRVLPGSHRQGRRPHGETALSDKNMLGSGLEVASTIDERLAVDLELRPGEASLHHVDLIHGSRANESGRPRIGFAIRYVAPQARQATLHHAVLLARGHDRYHHYEVRETPPPESFEEGLAEHQRLVAWVRETRRAQGLPG
jgi:ectoine hydroxylase-related dioxygenase (phytanoyl-CoA dioxygenase family)